MSNMTANMNKKNHKQNKLNYNIIGVYYFGVRNIEVCIRYPADKRTIIPDFVNQDGRILGMY